MGSAALALAGGLVVGGGLRDMEHGGLVSGLQAFGQYPVSPSLRVEAGLGVRVTGAHDKVGETLVAIAYEGNPDTTFRYPMTRDLAVVTAMADWTPVPALRSGRLSGALHLRGGLEARYVALDSGSVNPDYTTGASDDPMVTESAPAKAARLSPALGVALDAWFGKRFGLRWTGTERFTLEEEPDYGNRGPDGEPLPLDAGLSPSVVWSLDFVAVLP